MPKSRPWFRAVALLLGLLAGCTAPAPSPAPSGQPVPGWLPAPSAAAGVTVYRLDPARSDLRIYVFRGGRAAAAGHNHLLSAPGLEGWLQLPDGSPPGDIAFALRLRLDGLVVDDPALRAETGEAFAAARSAKDIAGTRDNLLGPRGLNAARFPELVLRSRTVTGDWPVFVADVDIGLHGQVHTLPVMIQARRQDDGSLLASGEFPLHHGDFGLQPFSVFGGLMAVEDAVAVRFSLRLTPTASVPPSR